MSPPKNHSLFMTKSSCPCPCTWRTLFLECLSQLLPNPTVPFKIQLNFYLLQKDWVASCLENRGLLTRGVVSEIRLVVPNRELALKSTSSYYALTTPQPLNHSPPPKPSRSISIISRNPKVYVVGRLMPSPQQRCSHPNFQSLQVCSLM